MQNLSVKLLNGQKSPPGGWTCFLPEVPTGGKRLYQSDKLNLVKVWVEKAIAKAGGDPDTAEARIREHTASRLYREGKHEWVDGLAPRRKRKLSEHWAGTLAFAEVQRREAMGMPVFTVQSEAERRAAICAACPLNTATAKGSAIEEAEDAAMRDMVEGRGTSKDDKLGRCGACSCQIRTIVHLVNGVLFAGAGADYLKTHPSNCWKHALRR
jgi:hypothetical protein